jgi:hypothetical protein
MIILLPNYELPIVSVITKHYNLEGVSMFSVNTWAPMESPRKLLRLAREPASPDYTRPKKDSVIKEVDIKIGDQGQSLVYTDD